MDAILKSFQSILNAILDILPDSPFRQFIDNLADIPYLGYFNYFVPVSDFLALLMVWGTAITMFYAVSALLRFAKAID